MIKFTPVMELPLHRTVYQWETLMLWDAQDKHEWDAARREFRAGILDGSVRNFDAQNLYRGIITEHMQGHRDHKYLGMRWLRQEDFMIFKLKFAS